MRSCCLYVTTNNALISISPHRINVLSFVAHTWGRRKRQETVRPTEKQRWVETEKETATWREQKEREKENNLIIQ